MRKLIIFLIVAVIVGCDCLSQIPTQTIYADENCEAVLPNYLQYITVKDNCEGVLLTQIPLPGEMLSAGNPWVTVVITATDISGLRDVEEFTVTMIDTIPPEIIVDSVLLFYTAEQRSSLLRAYHTSIGRDMYKAAQGPDSIWTTSMLRDTSYWMSNPMLDADSMFDNKSMLMLTSPGFNGVSWGTFIDTSLTVMTLTDAQLGILGYKTYKIPINIIDP